MGDSIVEGRMQNGVDMAIANIATRDVADQDEWEVYVPGPTNRKSAFFSVSHTDKRTTSLSRAAHELLGNPEWISVRINRSRGLLAFVASNRGEQSFKVGDSGHLGLSLLPKELNLAPGRYAVHQEGDMLITNIATDHS